MSYGKLLSVKSTGLGAFNELRASAVSVKPTGLGHLVSYGQLLCQ